MTLHVILGDGEMPPKELRETLADVKKQDYDAERPCWFLVQAKDEPTDTDKAIAKWLVDQDLWYEVITDGDYDKKMYPEPQQIHKATRLAPKIVDIMKNGVEEGEDAQLLALWVSDNYDDEKDRWLNDVGRAVQEAGNKVLALADGLIEVDMLDDEPEEQEEEEEEETPPAATIKSRPSSSAKVPSRIELEDMDLAGLKAVAANLGLSLPPRTRMGTYIDTILGEGGPGEVEIEAPIIEVEPTVGVTDTLNGSALVVFHVNGEVAAFAISKAQAQEMMKEL